MKDNKLDKFGILKPLQQYRRDLAQKMTPAEMAFWKYIIFLRMEKRVKIQQIFGWYILDFLFLGHGVVVELDGSSHVGRETYDAKRDEFIRRCGLVVLRFSNQEALDTPQRIIDTAVSHVPVIPVKQAIVRADSNRRCINELQLAKKGLMHDVNKHIVSLEKKTKAQTAHGLTTDLQKVFYVPMRKQDRCMPVCPNCRSTRVNVTHVRCTYCLVIINHGWIEPKEEHFLLNTLVRSKKTRKLKQKTLVEPVSQEACVIITKGRITTNGKRTRPDCPNCGRGVAGTWTECQGCKSPIQWE